MADPGEILQAALDRPSLVGAQAFTTERGWARVRLALGSWKLEERDLTAAAMPAFGIPVLLDEDLPDDVIEFRAPDGTVLERILLAGGGS